ncbi:MAG: bifunctional glutamate N-acetyltransferase/amino-acid acetyltransferase ArgJ [Caldicoprobacterales bacterium]|jgi:glutamate N-acetyltransferase/amino-acid N-acetyltransferase
MKMIPDGVCAPQGFLANGIHCGIRRNRKRKDLAVIYSIKTANAAAIYTSNLVKGAPLLVTREHLKDGKAQAILCNSGNANTCNPGGYQIASDMCSLLADRLSIPRTDVVAASTGVIGQKLDLAPIKSGIPRLVEGLGKNSSSAAEAIMTTDTRPKEAAVSFEIQGKECKIGGIAKGSGMINPNMATMLAFITTDCAVSSHLLEKALKEDAEDTFNMISVDGDTSTNDMAVILANGLAGHSEIREEDLDFFKFKKALNQVTLRLSRMIAADGEGATKLLECKVTGAKTRSCARLAAKAVIQSPLFKAAMFGADANWGRVLCALGYSGADLDVDRIDVSFQSAAGRISVCKNGAAVEFSEERAKNILKENQVQVQIDLNQGDFSATSYGCDLSYDYVKINGEYKT